MQRITEDIHRTHEINYEEKRSTKVELTDNNKKGQAYSLE